MIIILTVYKHCAEYFVCLSHLILRTSHNPLNKVLLTNLDMEKRKLRKVK